jgi:hypothetical protein
MLRWSNEAEIFLFCMYIIQLFNNDLIKVSFVHFMDRKPYDIFKYIFNRTQDVKQDTFCLEYLLG